jgi:spore coat polysaccharide biosynthesis predicted glycosyltransferase SpsG
LALRVLLFLDYDHQSGLGHVSRSRAIIEVLSDFGADIFMTSKLNPTEVECQLDFLSQINWITEEEATTLKFDIAYVDTYSLELLNRMGILHIERKIMLIDGNYTENLPSWPDLIIDLERSIPRDHDFRGTYVFGDIISNSALELCRVEREKSVGNTTCGTDLRALVNFGGSILVETFLKQLGTTFSYKSEIQYIVYCASSLVNSLTDYYKENKNVFFKPFSSDYNRDLANSDFLITNSGTSFVEGMFVGIPMVTFKLFENAQSNFDRLRKSHQVLYSGSSTDLAGNWIRQAYSNLQRSTILSNSTTNYISEIAVLEVSHLKDTLSRIN